MGLTPKQTDHLLTIVAVVGRWIKNKYFYGQRKHGGDLSRKATLEHLCREYADMGTYLVTHVEHQRQVVELLRDYLTEEWKKIHDHPAAEPDSRITQAYNILQYGNPEGESEEELVTDEVMML